MKLINLKIEKPVSGGYGLGFYEGKACFVPYALPGETVIAETYKEKKDLLFAGITEIISESEKRIKPQCPNFGLCGGCDYLNLSYEDELKIKKEILMEALTRTGRIPPDKIPDVETIYADRFHYRSHADVKYNKGKTGFFAKDSNNLVPFPGSGCLLLAEDILRSINRIPDGKGEIRYACSRNSDCLSSIDTNPVITENECGITYERDIGLFFQANRFLRKSMLEKAEEYAALNQDESFLDIGCGVGFFTLYLAKQSGKATGIDIEKQSIKWAKHNARLNSIADVEFKTQSASDFHPFRDTFDIIIADPPRAGLALKARKSIKAVNAKRIVYVSCSPPTFARDANDFLRAGYRLDRLAMLDMFPGTHHIEVMGLFIIQ